MLTRDKAIGLGLKLGSQRIGIDLSAVVPELVHSIYSDFDKEIDSLQKKVDELTSIMRKQKLRTNAIKSAIKAVDDDYNRFENWTETNTPSWNFNNYDYRIKEKPKTKVVWFWKVRFDYGWTSTLNMYTEEEAKTEWASALGVKRMDILGSEEVPND